MNPDPTLGSIPHPAPVGSLPPLHAGVSVRCATGEELTPQQLEQIEALDDVIFAALDGNPAALDESARLYREAASQTHPAALDESREQYLKRAEAIVAEYRSQVGGSLAQTFAALEILTLVAE